MTILIGDSESGTIGLEHFQGMVPLAGRASMLQRYDGSTTTATRQMVFEALAPIKTISLVFGNVGGNQGPDGAETDSPAAVTFKVSVVSYDETKFWPVFFQGKRSIVLDPGSGPIMTDPLEVSLPAGKFCVRVWTDSTAGLVPNGYSLDTGYDIKCGSVSTTDVTLSTTIAGAANGFNVESFAPIAILGTTTSDVEKIVFISGGSSSAGVGDSPKNYGFLARAMVTAGVPYLNMGLQAEEGADFLVPLRRKYRGPLLPGCTHFLSGYGSNDIFLPASLATVQANMLALYTEMSGRGLGVWQVTLPPQSTSTDGWITVGSQTANSGNDVRVNFNNWIRAGAPVDSVTKAAVAVGTGGALLAGSTGHPLSGYFECADAAESARDSSKWKAAERVVTDAAITSGANVLTSATANFTAADNRKVVSIVGAGTSGAVKSGATIVTVTNSTTVTINSNASTTVTGATCGINCHTPDGLHPSPRAHVDMAAAIDPGLM